MAAIRWPARWGPRLCRDRLEDPAFLAEVHRKGALFRQRLEGLVAAHPQVFEGVRGTGLMLGLKCKLAPTDVVKAGYAAGVLTVPAADNVLRLLPALEHTDERYRRGGCAP